MDRANKKSETHKKVYISINTIIKPKPQIKTYSRSCILNLRITKLARTKKRTKLAKRSFYQFLHHSISNPISISRIYCSLKTNLLHNYYKASLKKWDHGKQDVITVHIYCLLTLLVNIMRFGDGMVRCITIMLLFLSVWVSVCLSVSLSLSRSVCLSVCLTVY